MHAEEGTWVILELSPHGERMASNGSLRELLKSYSGITRDDDLFVPYLFVKTHHSGQTLNVLEGYIFVRSSVREDIIRSLESSPYTEGTVRFKKSGYSTIPDSSVEELRAKLDSMVAVQLSEGQKVRVCGGPLCGIEGEIVERGEKSSRVLIALRSLKSVRVFQNHMLEPTQ